METSWISTKGRILEKGAGVGIENGGRGMIPLTNYVFTSGINNQNKTLQTYQKSSYTGLLLNFKSFTSFSYQISLMSDR